MIDIQLRQFEGPLSLLLYLIRKQEMDIFDININQITTQYLDYIKRMKQFDLEVAGDFVAMAATLIQIKSRMLLPQYDEDGEEVETDDPRKELVQKLLEYQQFQEASKKMYERPLLGRDIWKRGSSERSDVMVDDEIILDEGGLFSLISLYRKAIRGMKKTVHRVATKTLSIAERILEIRDRLVVGQKVLLRELVRDMDNYRSQLLITFLSILELGKMGFVSVYQADTYGDIYLTPKLDIDRDVIARVEDYDSAGSAGIAASLFGQSIDDIQGDLEEKKVEPKPEAQMSLIDAVEGEAPETIATDEDIATAEEELSLGAIELDSPAVVSDEVEPKVASEIEISLSEDVEDEFSEPESSGGLDA